MSLRSCKGILLPASCFSPACLASRHNTVASGRITCSRLCSYPYSTPVQFGYGSTRHSTRTVPASEATLVTPGVLLNLSFYRASTGYTRSDNTRTVRTIHTGTSMRVRTCTVSHTCLENVSPPWLGLFSWPPFSVFHRISVQKEPLEESVLPRFSSPDSGESPSITRSRAARYHEPQRPLLRQNRETVRSI
ncbi:unnamed protein product [Tuber aestivum]|uniref:Uncharacterized protein n=1 Tax=Tuber aestivum TaxID=59557 RepID=A0A292Q6N6_9PEZI|nr:unnamed protein product [Tuber aestivum]